MVLWYRIGRLCVCPFSISRSVFSFLNDNLSECQWIFTKLGMCIDIVKIWFRIANGRLCRFLTELSAHDTIMAGYYGFTFLFFCIIICCGYLLEAANQMFIENGRKMSQNYHQIFPFNKSSELFCLNKSSDC